LFSRIHCCIVVGLQQIIGLRQLQMTLYFQYCTATIVHGIRCMASLDLDTLALAISPEPDALVMEIVFGSL
jgi:hypothetical protein